MLEINLIVYENEWIVERVHQVSDRIRDKLVDQTLFEDRCIKRIAEYLVISETHIRNRRYIDRLINEVATDAVNVRYRKEYGTTFSDMITTGEDGEDIEYEPIDVLANVESEIMAKEMIALLAKDDHRKKEILGYWAIGNTNNAYISRSLARTFGGNMESHRKAINRFRKECHDLITAI